MTKRILKEIFSLIRTQRVFTIATGFLVLGSTILVLLTSGRTAGAEAAALRAIDAQGTRTITIIASDGLKYFDCSLVEQIASYGDVSAAVGLGRPYDATAAGLPIGQKVGLRSFCGSNRGLPETAQTNKTYAFVSERASAQLGLPIGLGSLQISNGPEVGIAGAYEVPDYLKSFEPVVVVPTQQPQTLVSSIVVLVKSPESVSLITALLRATLNDFPPDTVKLSTSEQMASLRAVVGSGLSRQSRLVTLSVVLASALSTAMNVWAFVQQRRRDFGRRRALGATRLIIISLIVGQVSIVALVGAVLGIGIGLLVLVNESSPIPTVAFNAALVTAITLAAGISSVVPAVVASRRDPLRELRVP